MESNIWTQWAVWLVAVSASKKASNTPAWLSRQNRFHTEFQLPNAAGRARQVMVWTQNEGSASRNVRSSRPFISNPDSPDELSVLAHLGQTVLVGRCVTGTELVGAWQSAG